MSEWLLNPATGLDKLKRYGFIGFLVFLVAENALKHLEPSAAGNTLVCFAFGLLLVLPPLMSKIPGESPLRKPLFTLSWAYFWMALLYFFHWTDFFHLPKGYDAITDLVSSAGFVMAWWMISGHDANQQSKNAERISLTILCLLLVVASFSKVLIDIRGGGGTPNDEAARLILNLCNGAIFLSLYGQMRRLFPSPDWLTHILILLFGCAQIAAQGRDCLESKTPCIPPSLGSLAALAIAWSLLLGKVAFGGYASYLYFNVRASAHIEPPATQ